MKRPSPGGYNGRVSKTLRLILSLISWFETHPRRASWAAAAALLVLGFATYGQTLNRGWVVAPADDLVWLWMVRGAHLSDIPAWFTHQPAFFYRPLTRISYYLDYVVWDANPFGFRLTHLLLYVAAGAALGWLVYEVTRSRLAAFFAASLYEVYPGNWEAVYWISARADVLAAVFVLAALALLLRARRKRRLSCWLGAIGCTAAALFSKEMGLALPPIVMVWAVINSPPLRKSGRHWIWTGITLALMLGMAAGYWALRSGATPMGAQHLAELQRGELHWRKAILMGGDWWWRILVVQVYPMFRGAAPGLVTLLAAPRQFLDFWGTLVLWGMGLVLVFRHGARPALMLLLFHPLAVLPASGEMAVVPYRRFYYLPVAGSQAVTGLVCWAAVLWCRERWPRWGWAAVSLYLGLLGAFAWNAAATVASLGSHLFGR